MQFDLFHSLAFIGRTPRFTDAAASYASFFDQCQAADSLGFGTVWVAESHFSSEIQKANPQPVIPHYQGEVGLNNDSFQLSERVFQRTKRLGFGTAIFNIIGGNGGPIAAADRVRACSFLNQLRDQPRSLHIGFASGRFPYINRPFGIRPRNKMEELAWPVVQRVIFLEGMEIFLRLLRGDVLSSEDLHPWTIDQRFFKDEQEFALLKSKLVISGKIIPYIKRWDFERLQLVPTMDEWSLKDMRLVLGSHCPIAQDFGMKFADLDLFQLSFTPPEQIEQLHQKMAHLASSHGYTWGRSRMPRTVLVFIDRDPKKALALAHRSLNIYQEAMRGTATVPEIDVLLSRALIGNHEQILEQLSANSSKGFKNDDRLMLWFEFNQEDPQAVLKQMTYFADQVMDHV